MQEYVNRPMGKDLNYHIFATFPRQDAWFGQKGKLLDRDESLGRCGKLIMAANSLGQALDIPQRSLLQLREADLLVFEEDRAARQALKAAGIHRDYLRLSEHKEEATLDAVRKALSNSQTVLYMSAQGVPTLADPGRELLTIAYRLGASVNVIPGPSSITAALAACSFLENGFYFIGFLPREEELRRKTLQEFVSAPVPLIILETPYRQAALIESAIEVFGDDRLGLLAEDISGPKESFLEAPLGKLLRRSEEKLNFVLIIGPAVKALQKQRNPPADKKANSSGKGDRSAGPQPRRQRSARPGESRADQTSYQKQKLKRSRR